MGYDENNQFFRGGITPSRKDNIYYEYSLPDLTIEARTKILEVLNTFFDAYGY